MRIKAACYPGSASRVVDYNYSEGDFCAGFSVEGFIVLSAFFLTTLDLRWLPVAVCPTWVSCAKYYCISTFLVPIHPHLFIISSNSTK